MREIINLVLHQTFIQNAVLAGFLSGIACGITGTFVVIRRITYMAGGIAHAVLGGLGLAYYLGFNPLLGATVFAVCSAVIIGIVRQRCSQSEDIVISALWSTGMATGIIFTYLTPGYMVDLMSFLFGNILMVSPSSLAVLAGLDAAVVLAVFVFYRQLVYLCFDEEYSSLRDIPVRTADILLLSIIAVTVVTLIQTVGIVLVIALLTLPAAIAQLVSRTPGRMMAGAVILSLVFIYAGLAVSFAYDLPSGASIILCTGAGYFLALVVQAWYTALVRIRLSRARSSS